MNFKKNILKQILSLILATSLVVNPGLVRLALAEEPTPTPEATASPTPDPTPAPESTITTGDANAAAQTDSTVNLNADTVNGQVSSDGCTVGGSTSCPVNNSNSADVTTQTSADSLSGANESTNQAGDATIDTGDASAAATTNNLIDTNIIEATPSATPEATGEGVPSPSPDSNINLENKANLQDSTSANSTSGENNASNNGNDANINTGDSYAAAAAVNLINTNLIGSNFRFLIYNIYAQEKETINLNEIWKEIEAGIGSGASITPSAANTLAITINNESNSKDVVSATAVSGGNKANDNGGDASIVTGNSFASANLFNLINTNIIGANFIFVIINIFGTLEGDIVIPSKEKFSQSLSSYNHDGVTLNAQSIVIDNYAQVEGSKVLAEANSGQNESGGSGNQTTNTGKAYASATTIDIVNTTVARETWMSFILNNFGDWSGQVRGWSNPSASEQAKPDSTTTLNYSLGSQGESPLYSPDPSSSTIQNTATNSADVSARADSGTNQAINNKGDVSISTGLAVALASIVNFINTNILGGNFLLVFINIFGHWNGDFVSAYPDLIVSLTDGVGEVKPGDTIDYNLCYKNQGYDDASSANLQFVLPNGVTYLGDSSGIKPQISGANFSWSVGNLKPGEGSCFVVKVQLNPDFTGKGEVSFWDKIIPKAYAAESQASITVETYVQTPDPESNTGNNSASDTTKVIFPSAQSTTDDQVTQDQPVLEISAKNNVNDFIYEGDTVTFEITVKNTGKAPSKNTRLVQKLFNGAPEGFGTAEFDLGTIEPGKGGKLTFGLALADHGSVPAGLYHTIAQATGQAPNGNNVTSNESRTDFNLRWKNISSLLEVKAAPNNKENILGVTSKNCPKEKEDILPFVLLFVLSSLYLVTQTKPKLEELLGGGGK